MIIIIKKRYKNTRDNLYAAQDSHADSGATVN